MKKEKNEFEVVYLDDENIILEEDKRKLLPFAFFFLKYGRLITMIFASIAILTFIGGVAMTLSNLPQVTPPLVTNDGVMMQFDGDNKINVPYIPITKEYAEMKFKNRVDGTPIKDKFIHVDDVIEVGNDKILIFDDGSAVIIYGDATKPPIYIPNKNNVKVDNGKIVIEGETVKVVDKQILPDGTVIYEFENEKLLVEQDDQYRLIDKDDIMYDNNGNIYENTEEKEYSVIDIVNVGDDKVIYFNDGSAVVIYKDEDKLPVYIPNKDDVTIDNGTVKIVGDAIETINKDILPNGTIIYDFANDKILVEENGDYDLYDKNKGEEIARVEVDDGKIIYFDDGSAVIIQDDKLPEYVEDRDNVTVKDDKIIVEGETIPVENIKTLPDGTKVYEFENDKALIESNDAYKLVDKDDLTYDNDGNVLYESEDISIRDFSITNNTDNQTLKYRVVLEETQRYNEYGRERLLPKYIYYKLSVNNNSQPSAIMNSNVWEIGSAIEGDLKVENNTYILYEGEIERLATDKFKLGLWVDYETIGNDMQDKWFIGTIKVYAWIDE